jgi:hypothetical protein
MAMPKYGSPKLSSWHQIHPQRFTKKIELTRNLTNHVIFKTWKSEQKQYNLSPEAINSNKKSSIKFALVQQTSKANGLGNRKTSKTTNHIT